MAKIGVKAILIVRRTEAKNTEEKKVIVFSWEESDAALKQWAKRVPNTIIGELYDFRVFFEDGNSYAGIYILEQANVFQKNLLLSHIIKTCKETRIAWDVKSFLKKYDIPGDEELIVLLEKEALEKA